MHVPDEQQIAKQTLKNKIGRPTVRLSHTSAVITVRPRALNLGKIYFPLHSSLSLHVVRHFKYVCVRTDLISVLEHKGNFQPLALYIHVYRQVPVSSGPMRAFHTTVSRQALIRHALPVPTFEGAADHQHRCDPPKLPR
jgi:hypothetical protein